MQHDHNNPTPMPAVIALAWGVRDRPSKGPKRGLTLDQIVAAAIKVALTDGIGAVSMGRVAKELGASTMALYRYVAAKDDLLMLMVDAALGKPPSSSAPGDGWRNGMGRWATAERDAYRRNPWALRVPIGAPPLAPNSVAWLDDALRCFADAPLSEQQKLSSVLLISGFVRNVSSLTADLAAAAGGEQVMAGYGTAIRGLIGPDQFPALERAIASGALDDDDDIDVEFDFGLDRILDGIEVLVESMTPPKRTRRRPR